MLAAGIILMLIGAAGYLSVQLALADCAFFLGQVGRIFSGEAEKRCQIVNYIQLGGGVLFVIGIVFTIGGAVAKSE